MKHFVQFFLGLVGVVLLLLVGDFLEVVRTWDGLKWFGGWIGSVLLGAVGITCIRKS